MIMSAGSSWRRARRFPYSIWRPFASRKDGVVASPSKEEYKLTNGGYSASLRSHHKAIPSWPCPWMKTVAPPSGCQIRHRVIRPAGLYLANSRDPWKRPLWSWWLLPHWGPHIPSWSLGPSYTKPVKWPWSRYWYQLGQWLLLPS